MIFNYPYFNFPYFNRYSRYGYKYPYYTNKKDSTYSMHDAVRANSTSARSEMDFAPIVQ